MERAVILSNSTRLTLVIVTILLAIAIIHLVASSKKLEGRSGPLTLCVIIVLAIVFCVLAFLGNGSPDPTRLEGFVSPTQDDTAAVAELVRDAARSDLLDPDAGTPVEISQLELSFDGAGEFSGATLYARYTYYDPNTKEDGSLVRAISVNARGEATITDAEPDESWAWADVDTAADAIAALESASGCEMAAEAASDVDDAAQVFDGAGFVAASDYSGGELICVSTDAESFYVPAA